MSNTPPPGEDQTNSDPMVPPPPPNKFIVRRVGLPDTNVMAHEVEMVGQILRFRLYVLDPVYGPTNRVRCFNGWLDYEEVVIEPSRIQLAEVISFGRPQ